MGDEESSYTVTLRGKKPRHYKGEYVVEITGPHGRVSVNLANLLADYCALVRESGPKTWREAMQQVS